MKDDDKLALLLDKLRWLRLPGMVDAIAAVLRLAAKDNLSALEVIDRLADEETHSRLRRSVDRRISAARFPEVNTIEDFDYDPCRKKLRSRYLARALAYAACQARKRVVVISAPKLLNELHGAELHGALERVARRYVRADLLMIDDFAVLAMDPAQAKLAFQVISERYDYRRSTMITTNRPFKDWPKVFPDALNAQVIAERLTERSEHFVLDGKGYGTRGGNKTAD